MTDQWYRVRQRKSARATSLTILTYISKFYTKIYVVSLKHNINLLPRGRDPFGQRQGLFRWTKQRGLWERDWHKNWTWSFSDLLSKHYWPNGGGVVVHLIPSNVKWLFTKQQLPLQLEAATSSLSSFHFLSIVQRHFHYYLLFYVQAKQRSYFSPH